MKFDVASFGSENSKGIRDYSNRINNVPNTFISKYYEAEKYMDTYRFPIALFGTRRLGKTTVLNQIWNKYHTTKSKYIHISEDTEFEELYCYVESQDIDQIYIDEITNIVALDGHIADLLDFVIVAGIKLICSGTCSLLLQYTFNHQACGRFSIVDFNPPNYNDYRHINNTTFNEFMVGENTFYTGRNYIGDIARDISQAIERGVSKDFRLVESLEIEDIEDILEILVESCVVLNTSKPKNKLVFAKKHYILDKTQIMYTIPNISIDVMQRIFDMLVRLNIMTEIPSYDIYNDSETPSRYEMYINTPLMYRYLIEKYSKEYNSIKEGIIFESAAITQIYNLLFPYRNVFCYSIRTGQGEIEYDLVIQIDHTTVYLIDFKRSSTKDNKYKQHKDVIEYFSERGISDCIFQTVYLIPNTNHLPNSNDNKYHIDEYLNFLCDLIKNQPIRK